MGVGSGEGAVPLPRNKLVYSPVPKYTKMAIHGDSPVYSHFSILGHRVCIGLVYSLNRLENMPMPKKWQSSEEKKSGN